jgi:hypothetical protein
LAWDEEKSEGILSHKEYKRVQDTYWEGECLENDPDFVEKREVMQRLYRRIGEGKEPLRPFGEGMEELYRMIDTIESGHADSESVNGSLGTPGVVKTRKGF